MSVMGQMNEKRTIKSEVVPVLMDQAASSERERLDTALIEAINAARALTDAALNDPRLGKPKKSPVDEDPAVVEAQAAVDAHVALMADSILYIRLEQIPNPRWQQMKVGFPKRRGHTTDDNFGYNIEAMLTAVLEQHSKVAADPDLPASEWSKPEKSEVKDFMAGLPAGEFNSLFWAAHTLNESKISTDGLKKG